MNQYKSSIIKKTVTSKILIGLIAVLSLSSCGGGGSDKKEIASKGIFYAVAEESIYFSDLGEIFQEAGDLVSSNMTKKYKLPKNDVFINFKDCGALNAYYDPNNSEVVMCYELFVELFKVYPVDDAISIFGFSLMHELSHALIDQLDLPIIGKEEDAADSISTVVFIEDRGDTLEDRREGARAAVLAGSFFNDIYQVGGGTWTDSHSIGPQRLFNLVCWAGGGESSILQEQAILQVYNLMAGDRSCEVEYQQQKKSVDKLLSPYLK